MEKFWAEIEKFFASFQKNSGILAALLGMLLYFFNSARNRYDALVKARIEAHDKKMEAHEEKMKAQMEILHEDMRGHRTEMAFHNSQMREVSELLRNNEKRKKKKK